MNFNPNSYNALSILQKALIQKNKSEDHIFTESDISDLKNSTDKSVSEAAQQVLNDKSLLNFIDNKFSGKEDLGDRKFVIGELNAALISLNNKNSYRADLEAIKTLKDELVANHGPGPWDKGTLNKLAASSNAIVKAAANRVLKNPQLSDLIDNGFSSKKYLGDGTFQVGELDAAMTALNPLNPQMQDIDALKTILKEVEKSPNKEFSKEDLTRLANTPNKDNPTLRAAARRLLNTPGLLWFTDSNASNAKNDAQIKLQPWELKAMIEDLNPLSPKMLDISALRTLASAAQKRPEQALTRDELNQLVNNPASNPSLRAAAQRILNNPQMLQMADNAFSAPGKPLIDTKDTLDDGKIHAGELLAVAKALHPLATSSRNLDTLQTIKAVIEANPNEYKNGVMTKAQLEKLQQSDSPQVRQAAIRLYNNMKLFDLPDTVVAPFEEWDNFKFEIETLNKAIDQLSPYSNNMQATYALKVLIGEMKNNPTIYPKEQMSRKQLIELSKNGPPAIRQALAALSKYTQLDYFNFDNDALRVVDLEMEIHTYDPAWSFVSTGGIMTLGDYILANPDLKGRKIDDSLLKEIWSDPKTPPEIRTAARIAKGKGPAGLKFLKEYLDHGGIPEA